VDLPLLVTIGSMFVAAGAQSLAILKLLVKLCARHS
jgi:hypothetical protein